MHDVLMCEYIGNINVYVYGNRKRDKDRGRHTQRE